MSQQDPHLPSLRLGPLLSRKDGRGNEGKSLSDAPAFRRSVPYFLVPSVSPPKRLLKRATWPPESTILPWPPVQAGCTLGSMSRVRVSPSLPQVERVSKVVPSVICTLIIW